MTLQEKIRIVVATIKMLGLNDIEYESGMAVQTMFGDEVIARFGFDRLCADVEAINEYSDIENVDMTTSASLLADAIESELESGASLDDEGLYDRCIDVAYSNALCG